ncbi:MAG TPA: glycosyltransferase family 2 protein [Terriglobales bacterium]|nr:glycosyltransferase family 2 protein [Terriglobales bacterium]
MSQRPKVGVITITYNSGSVIDGFLASLLQQSYSNFVLFAVDNASSDQTLRKLANYRDPRIRVIANQRNLGFAEANNQGLEAAIQDGCELLLLMNNDTEFGASLIEKLVAGLDEHACDMTAPKILFHDHPGKVWSAGGGLDPRRGYSGFHYGYGETDGGRFDAPRRVDHAPACCLLARKEVFERIGMLDGRYFTYVEDTDFSYRAMRAGLKLMYIPEARVLHKAHSLTGGASSKFMMRYVTRNRAYFMLKHLGWRRALCYLPAYQAHLLLQLLLRRCNLSMFLLREKALLEGLRLWRHSQPRQKQA